MTAATRCFAQAAACAIVPAGLVKSTSTSAARRAESMSVPTRTPVVRPKRSPASCARNALPSTSSALAMARSLAASVASISAWPIRPPAPAIANFSATIESVKTLCEMPQRSKPALQNIPQATEESFVIGRRLRLHRLFAGRAIELDDRLRHLVAFPARQLVVGEIDGELPVLAHFSLLRILVHIVPTIVAEGARYERRA